LKKSTKEIKWWQEGRFTKVISGSETGKVQKAVLGEVRFQEMEPVAKYTQFQSEEFTLTIGKVFSSSADQVLFYIHSLVASPAEDVNTEGIVYVIGRQLKKLRDCELPGWVAQVTNSFKKFQL
jgi:hypothetical protein